MSKHSVPERNKRQQEAVIRRTVQEAKGRLTSAMTFTIEVRDYERAYAEAEKARDAVHDLLSDINELQYQRAREMGAAFPDPENPWAKVLDEREAE